MNRLPLTAIALTAMMISGCITFEEPPEASTEPRASEPAASTTRAPGSASAGAGTMTAQEATATTTSTCNAHALLPDRAAFCATKTHWIWGDIGLNALPVDLTSFNGNVDVKGGTSGTWNLTVALRARGNTEADARTNLENIHFTWSHQSGGAHALTALAKKKVQATQNNEQASMTLTIPASVLLTLTSTTTNGGVSARGLIADDVRLQTSNGEITVTDTEAKTIQGESSNGGATITTVTAESIAVSTTNGGVKVTAAARDYELESTNGQLDLRLRPSASGKLVARTTNGPINVALAEDKDHGYDLSATTTNGFVTVTLKDGQSSGSNTAKTFKTANYAARSIQTQATITSTNSMISVGPL